MSPAERTFVDRLRRRAAAMAPETSRRYLEAYRLIRAALNESELARAIKDGTVDELLDELLTDEGSDPTLRRLRLRLDQAVIEAARKEAGLMPSMFRAPFDIVSPQVIAAARALDTAALGALRQEVRDVIIGQAAQGLREGLNPRTVARRIQGVVGLGPKQVEYVENFRRELETGDRAALRRVLAKGVIERPDGTRITRRSHAGGAGLSKAQLARIEQYIATGKPIPPDLVEGAVEAYRKRLIALNVEAQTATAMMQAQKRGSRASWEDAVARGVVDRTMLRRRWFTNLDGRERPSHRMMHGETVGFDEPYSNGQLIPGEDEYNCRCVERVFVAAGAMAA